MRPAEPDEALAVRRILDAAMLEFDELDRRIAADDVLVAVEDETIRGVALLDPACSDESVETSRTEAGNVTDRHRETLLSAIAVRRRHRDRGIGRALIEAALDREGAIRVRFDESLTPFYESLAFTIEPIGDGRYEGVRRC